MKKAVKFLIIGTVQGVFFRQFCKDNADALKLKGYVRNLETGNVEIVAEGDQLDIEKFYEILKKGPPHAQIKNLTFEEKKYSGDFKDFRIMKF